MVKIVNHRHQHWVTRQEKQNNSSPNVHDRKQVLFTRVSTKHTHGQFLCLQLTLAAYYYTVGGARTLDLLAVRPRATEGHFNHGQLKDEGFGEAVRWILNKQRRYLHTSALKEDRGAKCFCLFVCLLIIWMPCLFKINFRLYSRHLHNIFIR